MGDGLNVVSPGESRRILGPSVRAVGYATCFRLLATNERIHREGRGSPLFPPINPAYYFRL